MKNRKITLSDSVYLDPDTHKICFTLNGETKEERASPKMHNVIVRMTQSTEPHKSRVYLTKEMYIDFADRTLCRTDGEGVKNENLKPKMYGVLAYLCENHGVQSQDKILDNVWEYSETMEEQVRAVVWQIRAAMKRLCPETDPAEILETYHGGGYKLNTLERYDEYTAEQMLDMYIRALKRDYQRRYDESFEIYCKLARQNHAPSVNSVGIAYAKGQGVEKDEEKGFEYYRKAADMGYSAAQLNTGDCYKEGRGTSVNLEMAVTYYLLGANNPNNPDEDAMFRLYECYRDGVGVERDIDKAVYWRSLAESKGRVEHRDFYKEN